MYAHESILDILFIMLYGATAMLTLMAALYLWQRRTNAFAPAVNSPKEVRFRASVFLFAATASHVWWFLCGTYWQTDDRLVRNIELTMLDHVTLVPAAMSMLLYMLQDRRRKLLPWLLAEIPLVVLGVMGIVRHDYMFMHLMNGYQAAVIYSSHIFSEH